MNWEPSSDELNWAALRKSDDDFYNIFPHRLLGYHSISSMRCRKAGFHFNGYYQVISPNILIPHAIAIHHVSRIYANDMDADADAECTKLV